MICNGIEYLIRVHAIVTYARTIFTGGSESNTEAVCALRAAVRWIFMLAWRHLLHMDGCALRQGRPRLDLWHCWNDIFVVAVCSSAFGIC